MKFKYVQIYASILATIFLQFAQCELTGKLGTDEEYDTNPSYKFEYSVSDPLTGDTKSQSETREGDTVTGYYQLLEPDGSYRTVNYIADAINGFRATVSKTEPGDYKTYQKYPATQNDYPKSTPSHAIIVTAAAPAAPAQALKDTKIPQQPQPYQGAPYYIPTASYYPQPQSYYYPNPYYYPAYQQYLNSYYRQYEQQQQSQQQHNQKKWN